MLQARQCAIGKQELEQNSLNQALLFLRALFKCTHSKLSAVIKPVSWRSSTAFLPPHTHSLCPPCRLPSPFFSCPLPCYRWNLPAQSGSRNQSSSNLKNIVELEKTTHTSNESEICYVVLKQKLGKLNLHADTITIR